MFALFERELNTVSNQYQTIFKYVLVTLNK